LWSAPPVEFLIETGIYCNTTSRVIQVDREEIAEAIAALSAGKGLVDNPDLLWYPSAQWYTPI
jgi:hypothetical protein